MKKEIVITGGAGFIGSNFVSYIKNKYPNYSISVVDALTYAGSMDNLPKEFRDDTNKQYKFWYGDVRNADLMSSLIQNADYVVHFAAETHVTRSIYDNKLFFETDVLGTHTVCNSILKAGSKVKKFVHISTSEVYGTAENAKMDEEHPLNPMSPYAAAKCGADRLVYSYYQTYKIPATIIRPFNNYGPRQHLEKLIPRFITSLILNEPLTVHGDGSAARDFIHVEDTCRAIDMVLHSNDKNTYGEVFNVSSEVHRSINEIADILIKFMDAPKLERVNLGDRPGQVVRHTGDSSKIKKVIGWEPKKNWEDGIKETIDWYLKNQSIWSCQLWMRKIPIIMADGKVGYH